MERVVRVKGNPKSIVHYLLTVARLSFTRDLARVNILPEFSENSFSVSDLLARDVH